MFGLLRRGVAERIRSVWVSNMNTGTLRSVRIRSCRPLRLEGDRRPVERGTRAAPAVDEDAVKGVGDGLERVGEGRQVEGRLGLADCATTCLGLRPPEHLRRGEWRAWPIWAKMSNAYWSPGWCRVP